MTKKIKLPPVSAELSDHTKTLPYNGNAVTEKSFSFSFACFDRTHELFNLGSKDRGKSVSGEWFIELMDCFKSVSNKTISELKSSLHDLHSIRWDKTNTKPPLYSGQYEFSQFRINKSKGRIIGFIVEGVFYIVWLDPHHNLTDSAGYGGAIKYPPGLSLYEKQEKKISSLEKRVLYLEEELKTAEELLDKV
ncbi:hypothetical protein ACKQTC_07040 [Peptococcus simiae]|uniref:Uncharacterized protein n=1 Tax=Peptococcus simiae TaxID=1643805 RepID=A0ABW9H2B2_9FIRM